MKGLKFVSAVMFVIAMLAMAFPTIECKPKLEVGMSYIEAKTACPDLADKPYDKDVKTGQVFYLCPSQHVYVVGDLKTTRMVGFLVTPEWQDTLRLRAALNQDSVIADFKRDHVLR